MRQRMGLMLFVPDFAFAQSVGGCQPACTQKLRTTIASGSESRRSNATVARPIGVRPTMCSPPSDHWKCSNQTWVRGLKSGTTSPDSGSMASVRLLLNRLHRGQHNHRLFSSSDPCFDTGRMCSISRRAMTRCCGLRQKPHRFRAAIRTRSATSSEIPRRVAILVQRRTQFAGDRDFPRLSLTNETLSVVLHQCVQSRFAGFIKHILSAPGQQLA